MKGTVVAGAAAAAVHSSRKLVQLLSEGSVPCTLACAWRVQEKDVIVATTHFLMEPTLPAAEPK